MNTLEQAIEEFQQGRMIIMVDDEDRENEGDLVIPAEKITPQIINFMITHARGLVCLALTDEALERLHIPLMVDRNHSKHITAFTVSIDAAKGISTGISAFDRAHTIQVAIAENATPDDLVFPGHIFPLQARRGGVLVRAGHTEGSIDLARLAGFKPQAVICEILNEDGTMARFADLQKFAKKHDLKTVSINQLISHRMNQECFITEVASSRLPTAYGECTVKIFENTLDGSQHVALIRGDIDSEQPILIRVHSECLTGEVLGSLRCDCGWQLDSALARIGKEGGVLLYMRQEGRGIGIKNKIKAYHLQDQEGLDTVEANHKLGFKADHRDYGIGSQILRQLGVQKIRLLTNNPRKIYGLEGYGLEIVSREPIEMSPHTDNQSYLRTKKDKLGHLLEKIK